MIGGVAKVSTTYICNECGTQSPVKMGKCPRCGAWGSMEAQITAAPTGGGRSAGRSVSVPLVTETLSSLDVTTAKRVPSGIGEVDRVLGGGWVAGAYCCNSRTRCWRRGTARSTSRARSRCRR